MRLANKLTIRIKNGFLPHLINEIYKRNCGIRNIVLLESEQEIDIFLIEIIYPNHDKYNGLLNKIAKHEDNFQVVSSENRLKNEITGGMLNISSKIQIDNIIDYEMNVLGATDLILNMLETEKNIFQYSGISKNIGLFCGISDTGELKENHLKMYALAERDSIIINRFSGLNAFPLLIRINQLDDFIKVIHGVEESFSAIRIFNLEDMDDLSLYERIYMDISLPVLARYYDEIPLYLLISISHLFSKNNIDPNTCTVGVIGINISSLRMARLLLSLGIPRVLGNDNSVKLMHNFEKQGGLATTQDNIFNNSDLIIFFKNQFNMDDINKVGSGQLLISLIEEKLEASIIKERGARDFLQSGWMDFSALFPGILKGLIESSTKQLDDQRLIKLSKKIYALKAKDEVLPNVFSEVHQRIPQMLSEL